MRVPSQGMFPGNYTVELNDEEKAAEDDYAFGMAATCPFYAQAVRSFDADDDEELTFEDKDIILVQKKVG